MKKKPEIKSAKQAQKESDSLPSVWSLETYLTQRTLIYCAHLLEQLLETNKRPTAKPRKASQWQMFMGQQMRKGLTVQLAAKLWRERAEVAK